MPFDEGALGDAGEGAGGAGRDPGAFGAASPGFVLPAASNLPEARHHGGGKPQGAAVERVPMWAHQAGSDLFGERRKARLDSAGKCSSDSFPVIMDEREAL